MTGHQIIKTVAQHFGLTPADLTGRSLRDAIAGPRQVAMALVRRHTKLSSQQIGNLFNRDHTTVLYALKAVDRKPDMREVCNGIAANLTANTDFVAECPFKSRRAA